MPGSSPGGAGEPDDPVDACPLCGGPVPPSRVALTPRRPPAAAASTPSLPDDADACSALARQRRGLADLQAELEAERSAAAGAACEAMSMILRLQRDKSEATMEARQYRRCAEERFAHDAAENAALGRALARRDAAVRDLAARLDACQARLLHLGFPSPAPPSSLLPPPCSYYSDDDEEYHPDDDDDPHHPAADVGTPRTHHLLNLNRAPSPDADKPVVLFGSPPRRSSRHGLSRYDDYPTAFVDEFPLLAAGRDAPPERDDDDDDADRVYTVDAVRGVSVAPDDACYLGAWPEADGEMEMQKLKARLQALESDRESLRHAIMSIGDDKAQVLLLREIAQQLCRDTPPFPALPLKVQPRLQPVVVPQRKVVKRRSSFLKIFVVTVIKWVVSIFCWRRKSNPRIRYPIGMCGSNVGLMLVLDRFPKQRQKKIPTKKLGASIL